MTLDEVRKQLTARRDSQRNELQIKRETLVLMEENAATARREAALAEGALHATEEALALLERAKS